MKIKTIIIPNRNERLFREGQSTETVTVEWKCPTCGEEMPEPHLEVIQDAQGFPCKVHKWLTECGHLICYDELKEMEEEIN